MLLDATIVWKASAHVSVQNAFKMEITKGTIMSNTMPSMDVVIVAMTNPGTQKDFVNLTEKQNNQVFKFPPKCETFT